MIENILQEALLLKDERLNKSFNDNHINSPKVTFLVFGYLHKFKNSYIDIGTTSTNEYYLLFYNFLEKTLLQEKKIKKSLISYFEGIAEYWDDKDRIYDIGKEIRFIYLIKKFIINSLDGFFREEYFYKELSKYIKVEKTNLYEDNDLCIDFKLKKNDLCIGVQIKPKTFFIGIKENAKDSFFKIYKATLYNKKPLFLVSVDDGKIQFLIRDKNSLSYKFINSETFLKLFDLNQTEKELFDFSIKSMDRLKYHIEN